MPKGLTIGYSEGARMGDEPAFNCEFGWSERSPLSFHCEDAAV